MVDLIVVPGAQAVHGIMHIRRPADVVKAFRYKFVACSLAGLRGKRRDAGGKTNLFHRLGDAPVHRTRCHSYGCARSDQQQVEVPDDQ